MPERVLLFLDFDGVLHPAHPRTDRTDEQNQHFACLPRLEALLREHPLVQVVISSDWRHSATLDLLRAYFSEDLRERVIGMTGAWPFGYRQGQIEKFLKAEGLEHVPWIALDDHASSFERDTPQLVLCNDEFADREEAQLRSLLARLAK